MTIHTDYFVKDSFSMLLWESWKFVLSLIAKNIFQKKFGRPCAIFSRIKQIFSILVILIKLLFALFMQFSWLIKSMMNKSNLCIYFLNLKSCPSFKNFRCNLLKLHLMMKKISLRERNNIFSHNLKMQVPKTPIHLILGIYIFKNILYYKNEYIIL